MALPKSKSDFMDYCLRKLGAPVIDINIDEEQVDDRIDEAILFYQTYHYDALEEIGVVYELTEEDIENGYITTPDDIQSVTRLLIADNGIMGGGFGTNIWTGMQKIAHDIGFGMGACNGGTTNFTMMMGYLAQLKFTFSIETSIEFQRHTRRCWIQGNWDQIKAGTKVVLLVYRIIDPEKFPYVWGDRWLQQYATALIGEQWGANLSKFDSVELPGGITLDGDKLYDRYHDIRVDMEEKVIEEWEEPVNFRCG